MSAIRSTGSAVKVSSIFQPCFLAVERTECQSARKKDPIGIQKGPLSFRLCAAIGCFFVRLIGAVSSSRPDHSEASRAAAVKHGRKPPRSGARRGCRAQGGGHTRHKE